MYEAELEMAGQMAKYADIIVAFDVVQGLTFSYKLGQTKDDVRNAIMSGGDVILWMILLSGAAHTLLICILTWREWSLRTVAHQSDAVLSAFYWLSAGRVFIVLVSTAVAYAGLWLNLRSAKLKTVPQ